MFFSQEALSQLLMTAAHDTMSKVLQSRLSSCGVMWLHHRYIYAMHICMPSGRSFPKPLRGNWPETRWWEQSTSDSTDTREVCGPASWKLVAMVISVRLAYRGKQPQLRTLLARPCS